MFTVLYRDGDDESLFSAETVQRFAADPNKPHNPQFDVAPGVLCNLPGGNTIHYGVSGPVSNGKDRSVIVMNEAGATVALYRL